MLPILFSIGAIPISSFGLFLALGFLAAVFIVWRLARAYDLDESKILDLSLLTFFGGLIFARAYFILTNLYYFPDLTHVFLINLYPGLSIWGGIIGGLIMLKLLTMRAKLNFWQIADLASVGFILSLVFGSTGCFLGGCGFGLVSNLPIAVSVVGLIGKRLPINIFEGIIFLLFFFWIWKVATKFHFHGKILSLVLIFLGVEKFIAQLVIGGGWFIQDEIVPITTFIAGIVVFYNRSKRSFASDLLGLGRTISSGKKRNLLLQRLIKRCYNAKISWKVGLGETKSSLKILPRRIKRKLNVKSTPRNY